MSTTEPLRIEYAMSLVSLEGATLCGYRLVKLIAEGGMGAVFEARGPKQQRVAVKLLKPEFSRDAEMRSKFLSEIAKLSRVRFHRGIVELLDEFSDRADRLAIVMEYLDGVTLRVRLGEMRERKLPPAVVLIYGAQVAHALGAMHRSGLAHGDLKPENIMIVLDGSERERIKIIDLGIAGWLIPTGFTRREAEIWGSGLYQAPELPKTRRPTAESDVFALGQILHECLTGEPADDRLDAKVPPRLCELIAAMRAEHAAERPGMSFVLRELLEIIEDEYPQEMPLIAEIVQAPQEDAHSNCAVHALPVYAGARPQREQRKRRQRFIFGICAAFLIVGFLALSRYAAQAMIEDPPPALNSSAWQRLSSLIFEEGVPRVAPMSSHNDLLPALQEHRSVSPAGRAMPQAMTLIPAGVSVLGSTGDEMRDAQQRCIAEACAEKQRCMQADRLCKMETFAREVPKHRVLIDHDFYMDNDLVTKADWSEFLNNLSPRLSVEPDRDTGELRFVYLWGAAKYLIHDLHPAGSDLVYEGGRFSVKPGRDATPAQQITWIGALYYCRFAGKELPSEANWEYVRTNSQLAERNPLLHMSPGLGEWMANLHRLYSIEAEPYVESGRDKIEIDPASYRVVRGCSAADLRIFCRPTARGFQLANNAPLGVGFRCMLRVQKPN